MTIAEAQLEFLVGRSATGFDLHSAPDRLGGIVAFGPIGGTAFYLSDHSVRRRRRLQTAGPAGRSQRLNRSARPSRVDSRRPSQQRPPRRRCTPASTRRTPPSATPAADREQRSACGPADPCSVASPWGTLCTTSHQSPRRVGDNPPHLVLDKNGDRSGRNVPVGDTQGVAEVAPLVPLRCRAQLVSKRPGWSPSGSAQPIGPSPGGLSPSGGMSRRFPEGRRGPKV